MTSKKDILKELNQFLSREVSKSKSISKYTFFLCRNDGVVLFSRNGPGVSIDQDSIGALIGGVWQAARALVAFIPEQKKGEFFRLSFDTSSQGIYILPVSLLEQEHFIGLIYFNEINPGLLKAKLRELQIDFLKFIKTNKLHTHFKCEDKREEEYLFKDITDDEMDELFSFSGM